MKLVVLHRRKAPALRTGLWLRSAWKPALVFALFALLLSTRSVSQPQATPHIDGRNAAATSIPCTPLPAGVTTWDASMGSIILPTSDKLVDPNACVGGIVVPYNATLAIDGSKGPVLISSHGAGINVQGGELETINTSKDNSVTFDAQPEVASWDGISIFADSHRKGDASLSYVSIAHALTAISISSGATSSPDDSRYGLTVRNSGIVVSYFDGIDAVNTPISVTGQGDGRFGTLNNIGSFGIKVTFNNPAQAVPDKALDIQKMTFGSSVPFAENGCPPLQPCSIGGIGNDAIKATFLQSARKSASITGSQFFKAGSYGLELENTSDPVVTDNHFNQNGVAATQPAGTCPSNAANTFPPIYLNNAVADLQNHVVRNVGRDDGLEAIVFNGTVSADFTWRTATTDPSATDLGFLLNGDLNMVGGTFTVPGGSVVKAKQGTLNLSGVTLVANDSGTKTFTSLRDSTVGIDAICSVFVQSAPPSPLPAGEWGGINLTNGSTGGIANAAIRYATTGVQIANGNSLAIRGSVIGPTFADGVLDEGTPMVVTGTTFGCPVAVCSGPSSGNHGILADFHGVGPLRGGLTIGGSNTADGNTFRGSVNEAIRGIGLTGQTVDIENNLIQNAGATGSAGSAGIYLESADKLTLKGNTVTGSGTGNVHYPAIWLNAVSHADFSGPISGNTGSGNALNAIAFHGDSKALVWQTVAATGQLGFIVDGNLLVAGDLTLARGDYAPVETGTITVRGTLTSTGAVLTSLNEQAPSVASCGSVFVPKVSGTCAPKSAGDWGGLVLNPDTANNLTDSEIRYATTGISVGAPTVSLTTWNLTMTNSNARFTSADGVSTHSPVSITGGAFTNNGARGIKIDLSLFAPHVLDTVITGGTAVTGSGHEGIMAVGLAGQTVQIDRASVDHAGAFGINLVGAGTKAGTVAGDLTLTNNTITNTAATYPAIYLNGFRGRFATISGNHGASNGLDAIAFHGTVTDSLAWKTARQTGDPTRPLGYLLDDTLTMETGQTLTVNAGDIVKVGKGGLLDLHGVNLQADNTGTSSQKVFTSLSDNSAGVVACPSALLPGCSSASAGDWGGISLTGSEANGTFVNAAIRYAATGIVITSGAPPSTMPSAFRLALSRSIIGPSAGDGIKAVNTAISVTDSTVSGGTHGITVDLTGATPTTALRLSGDRIMSTSAEAILGQALAGQPVWITDNHVQAAGTFGIRLLNADQLVLRNNNISASGGGPGADAGRYPAIYLNPVNADFAGNVRGNVGSANGLDAIVLHGTVTGSMSWITPSDQPATHPLGYLLDGGLTLHGGDLTVHAGDVVKSLGGPITIDGGNLIADDDSSTAPKIFTSLRDKNGPALDAVSCPSVFVTTSKCGAPAAGDWGGLVITENTSGARGNGALEHGLIDYAVTGILIDSGPLKTGELDHFGDPLNFRLSISNQTQIVNTSQDGINASDTPISVGDSTIGDPLAASPKIGARGIFASFFSPPNCPPPTQPDCSLSVTDSTTIAWTAKDGIVANGLNGQPVTITDTTITHAGTYGIRLVGADQLTLSDNTVNASGSGTLKYPAIQLNHVIGNFNTEITGNKGTGNGLDALVFDGTADDGLDWITPLATPPTLGYVLDGSLTVDGGDLTTKSGDIVRILSGGIDVKNGALTSQGTLFTSLRDNFLSADCPSVLLPSPCSPPAAGDWDGISIDGLPSSFTNGSIRYANSGLTVNNAKLTVDGALISGLAGYAIHTTNGGYAAVTCSGIHGNGGGISSEGAAGTTITSSDLYGNSGLASTDLDATVDTTATNVWWGGYPPLPTQHSATHVTINNALQQQEPSVKVSGGTVEFSSDNANDAAAKFGKGTLTVTLTFDRDMNLNVPLTVTFESTIDSTVHAIAGDWKRTGSDKVTWIGHALLDGMTATAQPGLNTLSVSGGTSCVREGSNVMLTAETAPFTLDFGTATVLATGGATNLGATSATLTDSVSPNGWSHSVQPPDLSKTDTHVFFQYRLDTDLYDSTILAGIQAGTISAASQLGYQSVGHGTTAQAVSASLSGLSVSSGYDYRVVAIDLNGITVGADQAFTTTGVTDHFVLAGAGSTVAGDPYSVTVTAKDFGGATVADYSGAVHFTSSDAHAVLPANYAFVSADNGIHAFIDAVTLKTAGSQTVTVTDTVLSTITDQLTVTVAPGTMAGFDVSGLSNVTAGVAQSATVTAKDSFNNTATGYAGTVHFTSSDGQAVLPANYTFVGADNGVHAFNNAVTFKTAGGQALTATDTVTASITGSQSVTITSAAASSLQLSGLSDGTAGAAQTATVTARDAYNNTATGYTGTVHFTSSDSQAVLPADYVFVAGDHGVHAFTGEVTLKTAGTQSVSVTDTVANLTSTQNGLVITPAGAATLHVSGLVDSVAGTTQSATVTAKDSFNNTATGYAGTVHFTSSDGQAVLPANYTFVGADNGVHAFNNAVTFKTAGGQALTATDTVTASITGSQSVTITSAAASSLQLSGLSDGTAGVAQTATVTARDAYNNTATGYTGTVHFTSSDSQAVLPADYVFVAGDHGVHAFTGEVTLKTAGTQSVSVTDTVASLTATQNGLVITPAGAATLALTYTGPVLHGTPFDLTVTAKDAFGNVATGYLGTVHFTSSDSAATLPADYEFQASDNGAGTFSVTLSAAGTPTVTGTDTVTSSITGTVAVTAA